ncbi:hypothetical protein M5689_021992 [Euphorbia peplus]|nr:hypothetical protein M5689_021992 [Euphorbia peplus]
MLNFSAHLFDGLQGYNSPQVTLAWTSLHQILRWDMVPSGFKGMMKVVSTTKNGWSNVHYAFRFSMFYYGCQIFSSRLQRIAEDRLKNRN